MNRLGIYLGWRGITLVDTAAKKVNNIAYVPYAPGEENADFTKLLSDPFKLTALIQKGLRELKREGQNIETQVALTQRDVLIRFFSMPIFPFSELEKALSFEIRKYIPFKLEELQYLSQKFPKPQEKKIDVLWVGIKKDTYKQYISILQQANIKIRSLEPAALSIIRLLINKIKKDTVALIDTSIIDTNITIISKGIPIFTREIKFSAPLTSKTEEQELIKLGNEFRMAFDFYRRQYTLEAITKIVLISDTEIATFFQELSKEMEISLETYRPAQLIESEIKNISVDALRAIGAGLRDTAKTAFRINLYKKPREKRLFYLPSPEEFAPVSKMAVIKTVIICTSIIMCLYIFHYTRMGKLKKELSSVFEKRPKTIEKYNLFSPEKLKMEKDMLQKNIQVLQGLKEEKYISTSEKLSLLAEIIPEGLWLSGFNFNRKDSELYLCILEGFTYRADKKEEARIVDLFVSKLKENTKFLEGLQQIKLDSRGRANVSGYEVEKFSISCQPR